MEDENHENAFIQSAIRPEFHCDSTGQPFEKCIECDDELIHSNKRYFIEKAIRKYPNSTKSLTIFEFAICEDCTYTRQQELSEESEKALGNYYANKTMHKPMILSEELKDVFTEMSLETCAFSGKKITECEEYQIVGEFQGNQMKLSHFPFAISGDEIEAISEILSTETKEEFDDFVGRHFSGPPEFQELWEKPKVILV